VAEWFAQRYGVRYLLPAGLPLWAVATIITGLVTGFALLVLCVLLGIGESVTYSCNAERRYKSPYRDLRNSTIAC
jgi:MFS family permease